MYSCSAFTFRIHFHRAHKLVLSWVMRLLLLLVVVVVLVVSENKANQRKRLTERKLKCLKCKFKKTLKSALFYSTSKESNASNKRQQHQSLFFFRKRSKKQSSSGNYRRKKIKPELRMWNEKAYFTLWTQNVYCFFSSATTHEKLCWLFSHADLCLYIPSSVLNMYICRTHGKRQTGRVIGRKLFFIVHILNTVYNPHSPLRKEKNQNQKRSDLSCHVYVKRIIILHAIETIHIAWMKKVLRNLPKMYQNLICYSTGTLPFRSVQLCSVVLCCVGGGGDCSLWLDLI